MGKRLLDIKGQWLEPVFAFHIAFSRMNVHGFASLIGVEKEPPSID